jgi:hypothetical protein
MTLTDKDMTAMGPIRKLGDVMSARMQQSFNNEADWYYQSGVLSRDERISLGKAMDACMEAFHGAVDEGLYNRVPDYPYVYPGESEVVRETAMQKVFGWLEGIFKATSFDDSEWSGSASNWPTAAEYCSDCLVDLNEAGSEKTKEKCHLPYRKPGSTKINKGALKAIGAGARSVTESNIPSDEKKKVASWVIRHWKAAFGTTAPKAMYSMAGMEMTATKDSEEELPQPGFFKDANKQWWYVGVYSNQFQDRDKEILSEDSHKEYAEWFKSSGIRPVLTVFHQPRMGGNFWGTVWEKCKNDIPRLNQVIETVYRDFAIGEIVRVIPMNGFSVLAARIFPEKYAIAEKLNDVQDELGMSHGFIPEKKVDNIFHVYRTFEASILPRGRASNVLTQSLFGDMPMTIKMSEEDRQFLEGIGFDTNKLENSTKEAQERAMKILNFKDAGDVVEPAKEPATEPAAQVTTPDAAPSATYEEIRAKLFADLNVEGLQKTLQELVAGVKELKEGQTQVSKAVAEVQKDEDTRIAEQLFKMPDWTSVGQAPTTDPANVISQTDKDKTIKESPANQPVADGSNPLVAMLWEPLTRGSRN